YMGPLFFKRCAHDVKALLRFLKKLFQFANDEEIISHAWMVKARASAIMSEHVSSPKATFEELIKFCHDEEEQRSIQEHEQQNLLFQQQMEEEMGEQQHLQDWQRIQDMHDPYQNPGQDIVVDEHCHHIDHSFD